MPKRETILVPDIGDFSSVDVVEVMISVGDSVATEDSLISLESDKASLDVPSPMPGVVVEVMISVGDAVSKGTPICVLELSAETADALWETSEAVKQPEVAAPEQSPVSAPKQPIAPAVKSTAHLGKRPHATPSVRRFSRELGVDLALVTPTGEKGRILKVDVESFVRNAMSGKTTGAAAGTGIPKPPPMDFSKFGPVEKVDLNRIQALSASRLTMSWLNAPQVTHFDEADISDLEAYRKENSSVGENEGFKLSLLPFIVKACTAALSHFPKFNASFGDDGKHLILKKFFHIGIAVDTPNGLMVPVIRDTDKKGTVDIAKDLAQLSARAREGNSRLDDFQGGSFTISSLGGIGGTGFTPIVNVPEVAILGVSRSTFKPVFDGEKFVPRLMLPLSLTYDHRVIDGAAAARFTRFLSEMLADVSRMKL